MKRIVRMVFLLLALAGSMSTAVLADGPPNPTCNPLTDPNCKMTSPSFR